MRIKFLTGLLVISILFNIVMVSRSTTDLNTRDPGQMAYGISSVIELVYSEFEDFDSEYKKFLEGKSSKEVLNRKARITSFKLYNLGLILESFEIIDYEYFESVYELSNFFSKFETNTDAYNSDVMINMRTVLKENSNARIHAVYKNTLNLEKKNIPIQLKDLFVAIRKCLDNKTNSE